MLDITKDIQSLTTDAVDVTGAKSDVVINRNIQAPQNTTIDQRTASVRVEIRPIEGSSLFIVDPVFTNRPPGLVPDLGQYSVEVKVNVGEGLLEGLLGAPVSCVSGGVRSMSQR